MKVKHVVAEFMKHTKTQLAKGDRAASTLRFYECRFKRLIERLGGKLWGTLTKKKIVKHLSKAGIGMSNTTRSHDVTCMKTLQNFAVDLLDLRRIFKKLEKPRANRREFIPTEEQIDQLLSGADLQFRMAHAGLASSAARPGEICQTQIENVDCTKGDNGAIVLEKHKTARKTGKPRVIPFSERMHTLVRMAIGERITGPVFLTEHGRAWSPTYLSAIFRGYRQAAGLPKPYVLYCTRHKAITDMLKAGVPMKIVSEIAGHSSVTTTEIYAHLCAEELGKYLV